MQLVSCNVTGVKCIFKVYELPFKNASSRKRKTILGKAVAWKTAAVSVAVITRKATLMRLWVTIFIWTSDPKCFIRDSLYEKLHKLIEPIPKQNSENIWDTAYANNNNVPIITYWVQPIYSSNPWNNLEIMDHKFTTVDKGRVTHCHHNLGVNQQWQKKLAPTNKLYNGGDRCVGGRGRPDEMHSRRLIWRPSMALLGLSSLTSVATLSSWTQIRGR